MQWLNYHHLQYFWMAAKERGISAAARKLHVTQPTVSGQIRELEQRCGGKLLVRKGNQLRMTPLGERVFSYADEIFSLGRELVASLEKPEHERPLQLVAGVVDALPKLVAYELLRPALTMPEPVYLRVTQGPLDQLLGSLSVHTLDVVLSDTPISPHFHVRAYNHPLGESDVGIFARPPLAQALRDGFPRSLTGQPFLLPARRTMLRRSLEYWFEQQDVSPNLIAEFDDSALLKAFAQEGLGAFAAPIIIADDLRETYHVELVGRCEGVHERYYALSVERRIKHPAVADIARSASRLIERARERPLASSAAQPDNPTH